MLNVICVKLGSKYPPEMVNNLFRMCQKNITQPFELFCYTDDSTGIIPEVNIVPFVDNGLDLIVYNKLFLFCEQFDSIVPKGPRVYFDLDLVIKSNIDHIVSNNRGELTLIEARWRPALTPGPPSWHHTFNSSCMTWESPHTRCIWEHLQTNPEVFMAKYPWGMDSFMSYERERIQTNIHFFPKLQFHSFLYGIDMDEHFKYDRGGSYRSSKLEHIAQEIPIILFNGPIGNVHYEEAFKQYYND